MKNRYYYLALPVLLFLLFCSTGCGKSPKNQDFIEVSGQIEAIKTEVRAQTQGRIEQVLAREGQKVRPGDLLCLIDKEKLNIQLEQVRAGLEGAGSKLKLFRKGTKQELIAMARNQLERAQSELDLATKDQERMAKLLAQGAISSFQKEQSDLRLARAQEASKSAQENYEMALRGREKEEIEMVEAEIKSLQSQEQFLLRQIQDAEVRAPSEGFLEIRHVEPGELAIPGTLLFSLIDLARSYVKAYVPERYLGQVRLGDSVEVTSDSFPGKTFLGKVDFISDEAEFAPKNIQTKEERLKLVFMLKSYLDNPAGELKPGMPVDVRIRILR
jgi:HlyD family secretion protein